MKIKTVHDRKKDESTLTIRLTKGEEFNYAQAELLRTLHDGPFLPFSYETEKDGTTLLSYAISDTITLQTYLGAELSRDQFRSLMIDVAQTVEACANNGFSYTELVFELNSVYMDPETNHMKWAYVPAALPGSKRASIQDLLRFIATKAKFVRKEDRPCSESLLDFLKRQTIFSLVDFKSFIDSGELKTSTGVAVSSLNNQSPSDPFAGAQGSGSLGSERLGSGRLGSAPLTGAQPAGAGTYDFVKAQAGAISAQETRASKSLAEQISFDVADVASGSLDATGAASWDDVTQHTTFTAAKPAEGLPVVPSTPPSPVSEPVPLPPPSAAAPVHMPPPSSAEPVHMPPPASGESIPMQPPLSIEPVPMPPPAAGDPILMQPPVPSESVSMPPPPSGEFTPMPPPSGESTPMPPPSSADPVAAYPPPASMAPPVAIEPPSVFSAPGSFSEGPSGSLASKVAPSPVASSGPQTYYIIRVTTGERYSLAPQRETTIGRSKRCDIRIAGNTNISRVHALLKVCDEGCYVMDQQTTNKTLVNGRELAPQTPHLAQPGDEIKLADERLRLELA